MQRKKVILSSGKDESLLRFHPWVFSGAIKKIKDPETLREVVPAEGEWVDVYSNKDVFLGSGHYAGGSIAIRMLSFVQDTGGQEFWNRRIAQAVEIRRQLGILQDGHTNVCRMCFAEGDGLPGLIADYYAGTLVLQCHSVGMHRDLPLITQAFAEAIGPQLQAIYDKSEDVLPEAFRKGTEAGSYVLGKSSPGEVLENGHRFWVDWEQGQKTGFFIDQRENRRLLAQYAPGKKVLNTFSYTGGFSVYAAQAGASLVHSVDSSKAAIALADRNMKLNAPACEWQNVAEDAFSYLEKMEQEYDIIVLDPPAFAKHLNARHHAVQGYKRLNREAMKRIAPGGLLFTFSCSQAVDRYLFDKTVASAAIQAGRSMRVLHHLSQPPDHAASVFHPEGEYLKGLVLRIE
ncbi:MAG: class I SAM-dependent rRNA methyltransferase [Bacteroidota bacterium]|jgi:23S rRNA (cytosine1962-C5)-methyltransferase